jgi:type IV secretory pathway VirB2 component (pilin)
MSKRYFKNIFLVLLFIQSLFCFSSAAFATTGTSNADIDKKFCNIINILKGGPMKTVAIIGIMAVGIGTFTGRFQWSTALITVGGVIIIFSAESIVGIFASGDSKDFKCESDATKP